MWNPVAAVLCVAAAASASAPKNPVVLVPGFTGCSLEYELKNKRSSFPTCPKSTDGEWDVLWLSDKHFQPDKAFCFVEDMEVQIRNGKFTTTPGVSVRPREFGGVDGLMFLDKEHKHPSFYGKVVNFFVQHGYKVGSTLFGAPYDWRYSTERVDDYFAQLKGLIEDAYQNTSLPVALFSHSLGPSVVLEFLHSQTQAWKDKHLAVFMAMTPVWSGNIVAVWNAISGLDCKQAWGGKCPGFDNALTTYFLREVATNLPSSYWTFPMRGDGIATDTWSREEVIIKTKTKSYTAFDMPKMLTDLGLDRAAAMCSHVQESPQKKRFPAPGVDTYVFYGSGLQTPSQFIYEEDFAPTAPGESPPVAKTIVYDRDDLGDGVVPLRSALRGTVKWPEEQARLGKHLEHKAFAKMPHQDTSRTLPDVLAILNKLAPTRQLNYTK